jgi:alpha-N-arabinofuranosidase
VFGLTKKSKDYFLVLQKNSWPDRRGEIISEIVASTKIDLKNPLTLRISATGNDYKFDYSGNGKEFINLGGTVSGDILSTDVAGGFTGTLLGLYATKGNDIVPE